MRSARHNIIQKLEDKRPGTWRVPVILRQGGRVKRMAADGGIPAETISVETGPQDTEHSTWDRQHTPVRVRIAPSSMNGFRRWPFSSSSSSTPIPATSVDGGFEPHGRIRFSSSFRSHTFTFYLTQIRYQSLIGGLFVQFFHFDSFLELQSRFFS